VPSLRDFYGKAFDWQMSSFPLPDGSTEYTIVQGGPINGGIGACPDGTNAGHVTFYIGVDDVDAALRKVEELGGKGVMGPVRVPGGPIIAHFDDPQGHLIGLVQVA